jgi:hypothetical protein
MSILHPDVARVKFPKLVEEIRAGHRATFPWAVVDAVFPSILIELRNANEVALGLVVDAENWNHRALGLTLTDPDFRRYAQYHEVAQRTSTDNEAHIYANLATGKLWFCTQGTNEFHSNYASLIAWESIRHLESARPARVIEECVKLIDLERQPRLREAPIPVPQGKPLPPPPPASPPQPRRGFRTPRQR